MASSIDTFEAEDIVTSVDSRDVVTFGEFGCVRSCWHKKLGKIAAKCFGVADTKPKKDIFSRAKQQATWLAEMKHENLQEVLGITTWDNNFALILEFTGGENLERYLHESKNSLDETTNFKLIWQLISAIEYLHNHVKGTFCHGDINPRNILLTSSNDVKLANFGSTSLIRKRNKISVGMLATGGKDESMLYSAPEFLLGATLHTSADIYSFGMVLYEILTKKKVYHKIREKNLLLDIILLRTRPTCINYHDLDGLVDIMEKCWDVESSKRPTSKEICEELKCFIETIPLSKPIEAPSGPPPTRALEPLSRFVSPFQSVIQELSVQSVMPGVDCQQITALDHIPSVLPHLVPTSDETTGAQNNDTIVNSFFQPQLPSLPFTYQPNMMSMGHIPYSYQQPGQTNMMPPMGYNPFGY